jgi:hypothetical protein
LGEFVMKRFLSLISLALFSSVAAAKLPPLSDEAKAKADEAKAKADHSTKVAAYQTCKAQDRVAAHYFKTAKKDPKGAPTLPPCADPGPFVPPAAAANKS